MKVERKISKLVTPAYNGPPPPVHERSPLSVFDTTTFDTHIAVIYAFPPPAPSSSVIEQGLAVALGEYRELAGRFVRDADGNKESIILNDAGVRFVEAAGDRPLLLPLASSPDLLALHGIVGQMEGELCQVQLTRFSCGSLTVAFSSHHFVADGHSASMFVAAWGRAARGLPFHGPASRRIFAGRAPLQVQFQHRGAEFLPRNRAVTLPHDDPIVVQKLHFNGGFLAEIRDKASGKKKKRSSLFESLTAHLWRAITLARGLPGGETTQMRIAVNGRSRMNMNKNMNYPYRGGEMGRYFGNLVLWALPTATVSLLLDRPLRYAAGLIRKEVVKVDESYFRSFIDFTASGAVEEEGLVPAAIAGKTVLSPEVQVDSWLGLPFEELDFGGGSPCCFMPEYLAQEGQVFILPSFAGDGSVDVFVGLFYSNVDTLKMASYSSLE